jgi:transposase
VCCGGFQYKAIHSDGLQYSWFCQQYRLWQGQCDVVMRQDHRAGEKLFVDYAGQTVPVVDRNTGEIREAQISVPRPYSTGGKSRLGPISKRGNSYLRQLFIQGAQALYLHLKRDQSALGQWLRQVEQRAHRNVAVVALANKMVRICWKALTSAVPYRAFPAQPV